MEQKLDLRDTLQHLGITTIFSRDADLSAMTGEPPGCSPRHAYAVPPATPTRSPCPACVTLVPKSACRHFRGFLLSCKATLVCYWDFGTEPGLFGMDVSLGTFGTALRTTEFQDAYQCHYWDPAFLLFLFFAETGNGNKSAVNGMGGGRAAEFGSKVNVCGFTQVQYHTDIIFVFM